MLRSLVTQIHERFMKGYGERQKLISSEIIFTMPLLKSMHSIRCLSVYMRSHSLIPDYILFPLSSVVKMGVKSPVPVSYDQWSHACMLSRAQLLHPMVLFVTAAD